eukprot:gene1663-7259_t
MKRAPASNPAASRLPCGPHSGRLLYFVPALEVITERLSLSDDVAGA